MTVLNKQGKCHDSSFSSTCFFFLFCSNQYDATNAAEVGSPVGMSPRFPATCLRWTSLRHILYTCRMYPVALLRVTEYLLMPVRDQRAASVQTCQLVAPQWLRTRTGTVGPLGHCCMSRHCCYLAFHHSCLLCHSRDTCITDSCGSRFPRHWQACFIPYTPVVTWANWIFLSRPKRNDFKRNDSSVTGSCEMLNIQIPVFR